MPQKKYKQRNNGNKNGNHEVLGVTLVVVSLFLLLCIVIPPILSVVSRAIFSIVLGVFGIVAYPILIATLLLGISLLIHHSFNRPSRKTAVCTVLLIFFGLIILQLASTHAFLDGNYGTYISDVYAAKYSVGGIIFGTIAFGIKSAITEIGCYVVFSVAILVVVAVMTNLVSRIRSLKRKEPVNPVKMPPAPTFTTRTDPQNVMPVESSAGLFVGTIERRTPPPTIMTETGRSGELPQSNKRVVTDYSDTPVISGDPLRAEERQFSAAHMALYGDSEAIKKKTTEEYKRSVEEQKRRSEPEKSAPETSAERNTELTREERGVMPPSVRTAADAERSTADKPKKIVHDGPAVFFPVEKHLEFNDEGIENADDIKRKLQEDARRRKQSDMGGAEFRPEPGRDRFRIDRGDDSGIIETFTPVSRVEPQKPIVREPIIEEPQTPIIDLDRDYGKPAPSAFEQKPRDEQLPIVDNIEKRESVDDRFLRVFGNDPKSVKKPVNPFALDVEPDDKQDEIINADIMRGTSDSPLSPVDTSDIEPDDILIGDDDAPTVQASAPVTPPSRSSVFGVQSADIGNDEGIIGDDNYKEVQNKRSQAPLSSAFDISAPAVDLSETHDITSDLIDGDDLSGMYVSADESVPKAPAKRTRGITPLDNQISMQAVLDEKHDESVVLAPVKRRKHYGNYDAPPIDLLKRHPSEDLSEEDLKRNAERLETVIGQFLKTEVKVVHIVPGPTVTRYEVECPLGVPVKQIESHSADIEYELASVSQVRIEAPIPGKRAVGIEVPNATKSIVGIRDIVESDDYQKAKSPMTFAVGKGISGDVVLCDLEKVPHLLIAGQTGSGKSACLNGLIISLLYKSSPEDLRFILVDPKRVEFSAYAGMPHLLFNNIIYEPNEVLSALKWAANEMERRYALLSKYKCNQLSAFNKHPDVVSGKIDRMPHIIMIIDELADIMASSVKRDIEDKIKVIAAKARAAGIHLIVATQRPSADVLTGTIKTNLTSRIAFKVSSLTDSRIILDIPGAEALVGKGDMLFFPVDYSSPKRVQGSFISDEEVASVLGYVKDHVECDFDEDAAKAVFGGGDETQSSEAGLNKAKSDPLLPDVLALVIRTKQASTSGIQRRFSIGFARASRLMDIMEELNYIGPATGNSKPRDVLITNDKYRELFGHDADEN